MDESPLAKPAIISAPAHRIATMIDARTLQATFDGIAAEYVRRLNLRVETVDVLCGQAIMSVADTAMLLAMIARLGGFKPMTTVQLQTSFLRPVPKDTGSVTVVARVLRLGKSLSYGEVEFLAPDGKLAAHATTTYAFI